MNKGVGGIVLLVLIASCYAWFVNSAQCPVSSPPPYHHTSDETTDQHVKTPLPKEQVESVLLENGFTPSYYQTTATGIKNLHFKLYTNKKKDISYHLPTVHSPAKKLTILHFWATWCGPCLKELPSFDRVTPQLAIHAHLIPICVDASDIEMVWDVYNSKQIQHLGSLNNPDHESNYLNRLNQAFGVESIPCTIFLNKNGMIVGKIKGKAPWCDSSFLEALQQFLQNPDDYFNL